MNVSLFHIRCQVAVALLSAALIAFQLVLMQVLSIVQWYHFASMVISVALLGFGASGTLIALARKWLLARFEILLPCLMIASGISMAVVIKVSQMPFARFDSYLLFVDNGQIGSLLISYFLFFVPFFLGALAIGLVFVRYTRYIGVYYFSNLMGSGLGSLVAIILFWLVRPAQLSPLTSLFALMAGLLVLPPRYRKSLLFFASLGLCLSGYTIVHQPVFISSEYKDVNRALLLPEAKIVSERISPYGLVQVVSSPALRQAPGLSLVYTANIPIQESVFINGNAYGTVVPWSRTDTTHIFDYTTAALPYAVRTYDNVLILESGTGASVEQAISRGARHIVAIEPHDVIIDLLSSEWAGVTDSLYYHPAAVFRFLEPRTFLSSIRATFDLISLPMIGSFGGTAGLTSLQEEYTLTKDAFKDMWNQLTPDGAITVSAWMDYPFRNPLKILATLVEVLEANQVEIPSRHLAAVRSWGTITFLITRSPLTTEDTKNVRRFCDQMSFDPALLPDLVPEERMVYNQMQDTLFFSYLDEIISSDRRAFYETYDFRVTPTTDDRPYFSQVLRMQNISDLKNAIGRHNIPFLELGSLIIVLTLLQIFAVAIILIVLPLLRLGWRGSAKRWTMIYFGGLGLGFMFVEIVFIQRFTLYFGHPLYAAAAVIAAILIFSGAGSYLSDRMSVRRRSLIRASGIILVLLLFYSVALTPLLRSTMAFPTELKVLCSFILIAPPAIAMGFPFPIGLRFLSRHNESLVPWAWGINGCLSVVSTTLATVLAVYTGFVIVMVIAGASYGLAAIVSIRPFPNTD